MKAYEVTTPEGVTTTVNADGYFCLLAVGWLIQGDGFPLLVLYGHTPYESLRRDHIMAGRRRGVGSHRATRQRHQTTPRGADMNRAFVFAVVCGNVAVVVLVAWEVLR